MNHNSDKQAPRRVATRPPNPEESGTGTWFRSRSRSSHARDRSARLGAGFTLGEVMLSSGVVAISFIICCSAILFDQIGMRKAKEDAVAMDFLIHYAENVKSLPFSSLLPNVPINALYNGAGGAPRIVLPPDSSWFAVDTPDYFTFHPDLLWLSGRNPKMQVTLNRNVLSGVLHDVELNLQLSWDPPLNRGLRESVQIDMLRTKDL